MNLTLYQAGFFELLEWRGDFLDRARKAVIKLLTSPNHLQLGTAHLWTLTKLLTLVT